MVHPEVKNWIKYARFEERHGYIAHGRKVYERAVEFFGEEHVEENLFVAFAKFEETQKEVCWRGGEEEEEKNRFLVLSSDVSPPSPPAASV